MCIDQKPEELYNWSTSSLFSFKLVNPTMIYGGNVVRWKKKWKCLMIYFDYMHVCLSYLNFANFCFSKDDLILDICLDIITF